MTRPRRPLALLASLLLASGCSEPAAPDAPAWTAASVLAALADGCRTADVESLVEDPALEGAVREDEDAAWRGLTHCLQRALEEGSVERAAALRGGLLEHFGGRGHTGRHVLSRAAIAGGLAAAALESARRRVEVPREDAEGAARALAVARAALADAGAPDLEDLLLGVEAWVDLGAASDLGGDLAPHAGPRVVCYADDFLLGEPVLPSVLSRWAREGALGGLRVGVVPVLRGTVREGIRRVAARPGDEAAHLARRLANGPVLLEPGRLDAAAARRRLGLGAEGGAVLVLSREGRVLGRLSGTNVDPRPLEALVQRATAR